MSRVCHAYVTRMSHRLDLLPMGILIIKVRHAVRHAVRHTVRHAVRHTLNDAINSARVYVT